MQSIEALLRQPDLCVASSINELLRTEAPEASEKVLEGLLESLAPIAKLEEATLESSIEEITGNLENIWTDMSDLKHLIDAVHMDSLDEQGLQAVSWESSSLIEQMASISEAKRRIQDVGQFLDSRW